MEDTEANNPKTESLNTQYNRVVKKTTASPVEKFGNFNFMSEPIADFQGNYDGASNITQKLLRKLTSENSQYFVADEVAENFEMVSSRDVDLHFHYNRVINEGTLEAYNDL